MKKRVHISIYLTLLAFLVESQAVFSQTVYTFTAATAVGTDGPTQAMLNTEYSGTNLAGSVTSVNGIQFWEIPGSGNYRIEAYGGQGYGSFGGRGAHISGEFYLNGGDTLKILVGQTAGHYLNYPATTYNHQFGGGGGSFVTSTTNTPFVVAGGGGGNHGTSFVPTCDGQTTTSGGAGTNASTTGAGGTNGSGGLQATSADGGAGLLGNGDGTAGGFSFVNGGRGGFQQGTGGFGGGGGTSSWNNYRGGGGGGYSGGGGSNNAGTCCPSAGGGGSFNGGTNQTNLAGVQLGDGKVVITRLTIPPNDGGIEDIEGFAPPVCSGTHPVNVVVKNYGNNQISGITIKWEVDGVAQTDAVVTSIIDTANGTGFDTLLVNLGNVTISGPTSIKVWTHMPNSVADVTNVNDTMEISIAQPVYIATAEVLDTVNCNGGNDGIGRITIAGGAGPFTISWSNGGASSVATGLSGGIHKIVVTDKGGCKDSTNLTMPQPQPFVVTPTITGVSAAGNDGAIGVIVTGGTPPYDYLWSSGQIIPNLSGLTPGTYTLMITDDQSCGDTTSFEVMSYVGLNEPVGELELNVYPNPSTSGLFNLNVKGFTTNKNVQVQNAIGKLITEFTMSSKQTTIDLSNYPKGIYLVKVSHGTTVKYHKLIFE